MLPVDPAHAVHEGGPTDAEPPESAAEPEQGIVPLPVSDEQRAEKLKHTREMERLMGLQEDTQDPQEMKRLWVQLRQFDQAPKLRGMFFDGDNWGDLYFLWSLERMAVIYDLKMIEGKAQFGLLSQFGPDMPTRWSRLLTKPTSGSSK